MYGEHSISKATVTDIQALVPLINSAYRGEEAKKGWTHEADLIEGSIRTDPQSLEEIIKDDDSVILKYEGKDKDLLGCVYLKKSGEELYLGMLSVAPNLQGKGIGKKFLKAAEEHAATTGCTTIVMNVIPVRQELIAWYTRHGYRDTGIKKPFHEHDRFGIPRQPLEFAIFRKDLV